MLERPYTVPRKNRTRYRKQVSATNRFYRNDTILFPSNFVRLNLSDYKN